MPDVNAALRAALAPTPKRPAEVVPLLKQDRADWWTQNDGYRAIEKRSGGLCECKGIGVPGCGQRAWIHHHIAGRKVDDPHNPENLLYLTDPHHRSIHAHPQQSYRDGTMRSRVQ